MTNETRDQEHRRIIAMSKDLKEKSTKMVAEWTREKAAKAVQILKDEAELDEPKIIH